MQTATGHACARAGLYSRRGGKGPAKTRRKRGRRGGPRTRDHWGNVQGQPAKGKAPDAPPHKRHCQCAACRKLACDVTAPDGPAPGRYAVYKVVWPTRLATDKPGAVIGRRSDGKPLSYRPPVTLWLQPDGTWHRDNAGALTVPAGLANSTAKAYGGKPCNVADIDAD